MIKDIEKTHIFSKEEKLKNFGHGPWIDEPDLYIFEYQDIKCEIKRIIATEVSGDVFGGYLCGYCHFPDNYLVKGLRNLDIDVHGGITFFEKCDENNVTIIGFDCAHSGDLVPSSEIIKERYKLKTYDFINYLYLNKRIFKNLNEKQIESIKKLIQHTYRDIDYVISECKNLADQIIKDYKK